MPGVTVSRILPPKEDVEVPVTTSFRIPPSVLKDLDEVSEESGYTRTDVMIHFLRWALQEYRAEQSGKKSRK